MFVTNWISTTKIQKISEITNFFRHYFLSRTEVSFDFKDGANADVEYFYDANGALVKDLNKGISNIEYDVLGNLYGHAYFYELKQKNPSIEPSHTFGVVGYVKEFDPYFNQVVSYPVFGKNNTELEEQINIVEQQAIDNYEKNNR